MAKSVFCITKTEAQAITIVDHLKTAGFSPGKRDMTTGRSKYMAARRLCCIPPREGITASALRLGMYSRYTRDNPHAK
jgi:hypothetical protein